MDAWKKRELKKLFRKIYFFCLPTSRERIKFIREKKIFHSCGENLFFQPRKLPADPQCIAFHNNVVVAANVTFITHDVIHAMLQNLDERQAVEYLQCIEVMDNVFIGMNTTILPDVRIGPNAVVATGSVVTKDVPPNSVVAGVPARVVGTFEDFCEKRLKNASQHIAAQMNNLDDMRVAYEWDVFMQKRGD